MATVMEAINELRGEIASIKATQDEILGNVEIDDVDDDSDFDESQLEAIDNSSNKANGKSA